MGRRQGEEECKKTEGMSEENLLKKTKKKKKKENGGGGPVKRGERVRGRWSMRAGVTEPGPGRPRFGASDQEAASTWETDVRGVGDGREA